MDKKEMIWIASKYAAKGYSYDDIRYGDDCYDLGNHPCKEEILQDIFAYYDEYQSIGSKAFREKYKDAFPY